MAPKLSDVGLSEVLWATNTTTKEWNRVIVGIYCLTSHLHDKSIGRFSIATGKIALCNPATNDYKCTNPFPFHIYSLLSRTLPKPCLVNLGFGSVRKNSLGDLDYKVVVLVNYGAQLSSLLSFVYSLESGEWKKIVDFKRGKTSFGDVKSALVVQVPYEVCPQSLFQGCWHWITIAEAHNGSLSVLSFNFADEAFKLIAGPPRGLDYNTVDYMTATVFVLHGHLAVIQFFKTFMPKCVQIDVWIMKEYGIEETWTRIYTIKPDFYGKFRKFAGIDSRPLGGGGIHIERLFFVDANKQIISCDHTGYKVLSVWHHSSTVICWNTPGISTHVNTLERL